LSEAAKALWLLRPDSPTPRRILLRQLDGDDEPWVAARILGEIGPQLDAVDAVIQRLRAEKAETRQFAAQALGDMNPQAAAPAQPELERLLNDPEQDVRHAAESALQRLRAPARTE
jgi:HEAT repeat protein